MTRRQRFFAMPSVTRWLLGLVRCFRRRTREARVFLNWTSRRRTAPSPEETLSPETTVTVNLAKTAPTKIWSRSCYTSFRFIISILSRVGCSDWNYFAALYSVLFAGYFFLYWCISFPVHTRHISHSKMTHVQCNRYGEKCLFEGSDLKLPRVTWVIPDLSRKITLSEAGICEAVYSL